MPRSEGPRFIHEFELDPTPAQARELGIRLDLARQMYNAFLGQANRRMKRCKRDPRWKQAGQLSKAVAHQVAHLRKAGKKGEAKALCAPANALYAAVKRDVIVAERLKHEPEYTGTIIPDLKHPDAGIMTRFRQAHFKEHLDFKSCQAMATRAYATVNKIVFARPTKRKDGTLKFPRARFAKKGESKALDSISIHWRGDHLEWNNQLHTLKIPVRFDTEDRHGIQAHALAAIVDPKNVCEGIRVLSRTIRGQERWFTQLTIKGHAAWKDAQYPPGHEKTIGIDFGPSQIGIFSEAGGAKLELAEGLRHDYARIRRLQRYLDRSRRATNPDNYHDNGTIKRTPGTRLVWHKSTRYLAAQKTLADLWRGYAAHRKNLLGKLANEIIAKGTIIKIEALSYKAWQKHWGKSIGRGAPGMLVAMLRRKVEQISDSGRELKGARVSGGQLIEFPTRHTKFSQLCHGCGSYKKKPLSKRIHQCECGVGPIDRDIYSAFLAYHYDIASQTLDIGAARAAFGALQCPATGVQDIQAASAQPPREAPSSVAREDQSGSVAQRALLLPQISADEETEKRAADIPTFQDFPSIAGSINSPGGPRTDLLQEHGPAPPQQARGISPRALTKGRSAQEALQLWLFKGL